jgi:hypothetical protein
MSMRAIILTCCGETILLPPAPLAIDCPQCGESFTEADIEELACAQAPMLRPLFEEPTAEIEREDPWSGPKGFMLGGWSLPTRNEMAMQYFDAANLLVQAIKQNEVEERSSLTSYFATGFRRSNPACPSLVHARGHDYLTAISR